MNKIFVDWGSTNFRAFLVTDDQQLLDSREVLNKGIFSHNSLEDFTSRGDNYSLFLKDHIGSWLADYPDAPILMCGAIGSREGWVQVDYITAPASTEDLGKNLYWLQETQLGRLSQSAIAIVPGVKIVRQNNQNDIMRSEEIKSLGSMESIQKSDGLVCLPGTHCKWVEVKGNKITNFHTLMTGELYGLLSTHGSLSTIFRDIPSMRIIEGHHESFDIGLNLASEGNDLLADLFKVRAAKMTLDDQPHSLQSMMSGVLIGHEVREGKRLFPSAKTITIVSNASSKRLFYQRALNHFGLDVDHIVDSDTATLFGFHAMSNYMKSL